MMVEGFLKYLQYEKRFSAHTIDAYKVDLEQFSAFLQNQYAACGGDDYELCFTAPISQRDTIEKIGFELNTSLVRIGKILPMENATPNIKIITSNGVQLSQTETDALLQSFNHFA